MENIKRHGSVFMEPYFGGGDKQGVMNRIGIKLMESGNSKLRELGERIHRVNPSYYELAGKFGHGEAGKKALKYIRDKNKFIIPSMPINLNRLKSHFRIKPKNTYTVEQKVTDALARIDSSKILESKAFKGIGRTDALATLLKQRRKGETIKDLLDRSFGSKGWVAKKTHGSNTISSRGGKTPGIYFSGDANAGEIGSIAKREHKNWLVQPNKNLASTSVGRRLLDKLVPLKNMSNMNEYRVHIVNGKVVPYATMHRGSASKSVLDPFMPWRSREIRNVDRYAQEQMNAVKNKHLRKGSYGFDVAIDNKGRPQLIETNPFTPAGVSGLLVSPTVTDSISAAAAGELPTHVKARRAVYGGAGLLGGGTLLANGLNHREKTEENKIARTI
jgi:hypothetical protein